MSDQSEERSVASGPSSYDAIAKLSQGGPPVPQPVSDNEVEGDSSFDHMLRLHGLPTVDDVNRALPDDDRRVLPMPADQFEKMITAIVTVANRGGIPLDDLYARVGAAMETIDPNFAAATAEAVPVREADMTVEEFEHPGLVEVWCVFDGPPSGRRTPRFVEVEDAAGEHVGVDGWAEGASGTWRLGPFLVMPRLPEVPVAPAGG